MVCLEFLAKSMSWFVLFARLEFIYYHRKDRAFWLTAGFDSFGFFQCIDEIKMLASFTSLLAYCL